MYTATQVTKADVPLFQVVRDATQQTVLVTHSKDRAEAAATVLTQSLLFRLECFRAAGYHLAVCVLANPDKPHSAHPLHWVSQRVAGVTTSVARLDNLWTAEVRQDGADSMYELTLVSPSGVTIGRPVLAMSLESAQSQAVELYMRRFPKDLEHKITAP